MTEGIHEKEPDPRIVYADIIDMPRPQSERHQPMSLYDRAAIFSPFAALTGYDDMIGEEERLTDTRRELTDDEKSELNRVLYELSERPHENIPVRLVYFKPDKLKSGGEYVEYHGIFKYYAPETGSLVFRKGAEIKTESIIYIRIEDREKDQDNFSI